MRRDLKMSLFKGIMLKTEELKLDDHGSGDWAAEVERIMKLKTEKNA